MPNLPPIRLPGQPKPAPGPAAKIATHALAVILGVTAGVGGNLAVQEQSKPKEEVRPKDEPKHEAPRLSAAETWVTSYEARLRAAWAKEAEGTPSKYEKAKRLRFLYRQTILAIESESIKDLAELSKGFKEQEAALRLTGQLPLVREVITAEWTARIEQAPITPLVRVEIAVLLRTTVRILEALPQ